MKHEALLRRVREAVRTEQVHFPGHALDEMERDGESPDSVLQALCRAKSLVLQPNGRWRLRGEGLVVILHIDDSVVRVITAYAG